MTTELNISDVTYVRNYKSCSHHRDCFIDLSYRQVTRLPLQALQVFDSYREARLAVIADSLAQGNASIRTSDSKPAFHIYICGQRKEQACLYRIYIIPNPEGAGVRISTLNAVHTCVNLGLAARLGVRQRTFIRDQVCSFLQYCLLTTSMRPLL